jgi:hypothetical protein
VGASIIVAAYIALEFWGGLDDHRHGSLSDYTIYTTAASHWLATGRFYDFAVWGQNADGVPHYWPVLYPPPILLLMVPFTVLPAPLWWIIPIGVTTWAIRKMQPAQWTWPLLMLAFCYPRTGSAIWYGNPTMWIVMFVALGCLYRWPGPLVLLKPTLAPYALVGINSRAWWVVLAGFVAVSAIFGGLWFDYFDTISRNHIPLNYSMPDMVTTALPLIAAAGRDRRTFHSYEPSARFLIESIRNRRLPLRANPAGSWGWALSARPAAAIALAPTPTAAARSTREASHRRRHPPSPAQPGGAGIPALARALARATGNFNP